MTDREAAFHWRCEDAHVNDAPPATRAHAGQDRCHLEPVDGAVDGRHKVRDPDAPESAVRFAGTVAGERGVAALRDGLPESVVREAADALWSAAHGAATLALAGVLSADEAAAAQQRAIRAVTRDLDNG
jgi:hypothetical protein